MRMKPKDFIFSDAPEPHRLRTKQILKQHPQIRNLIGKNLVTFYAILFLVGIQVTGAWLLADQSWWLVLAAAYLIGAFADHSFFVMIHEATHKLIFKTQMPTGMQVFWLTFHNCFKFYCF